MKIIRSSNRPLPFKRKRRRGPSSETRVSFVLSAVIHAALILLIGITGANKATENIKLTEIQYIEERYGEEVAKQVTVAPEKLPRPKRDEPVLREGSIFAEKKEPERLPPGAILGADMSNVPLPKPMAKKDSGPFQEKPLKSRQRSGNPVINPKVSAEKVLLAAGLEKRPEPTRIDSEGIDLEGKVLVGKESPTKRAPVFEVDAGGEALATSTLTLALPSGGSAKGHPELRGGSLNAGHEAYKGELPVGNLVAGKGKSRGEGLAQMDIDVPGSGDGGPVSAPAIIAPTAGKGLISRGGSDAISRGTLRPKGGQEARPATPLSESITPQPSAPKNDAPAQSQSGLEGKGVSMTLSGPILGRVIISSIPPEYPAEAKLKGWQGAVSVYFTVRPDGSVNKVLIEKASAHQTLDQAARDCLAQWRFSPMLNKAEQWGVLTVVFRLRS